MLCIGKGARYAQSRMSSRGEGIARGRAIRLARPKSANWCGPSHSLRSSTSRVGPIASKLLSLPNARKVGSPGNPWLGEAAKRGTEALMARRAQRDAAMEPIIAKILAIGVNSYQGVATMLNAAR